MPGAWGIERGRNCPAALGKSAQYFNCRGRSSLVPLLGTSYRGIWKQNSQKRRTPDFSLDAVCKLASCRGDCLGGGRAALRWAWFQSGRYRGTFETFCRLDFETPAAMGVPPPTRRNESRD